MDTEIKQACAQIYRELSTPIVPIPTGVTPQLTVSEGIAPLAAIFLDVYGTMVLSAAGELAKDAEHHAGSDPVRAALVAEGIDAGEELTWLCLLEIIRSHHAAARERGIDFPEVDILEVWRELTDGMVDDATLSRLAVRCETAGNPCWPEPTLAETLAELKMREIPLGIISNAQFYTREMLEAFLCTSLEDAGIHPQLEVWSHKENLAKPSPMLYEIAAQRLYEVCGIPSSHAAMVGNDLRNDIAPAVALGFQGILYAGDARSLRLRQDSPALANLKPHYTITSLQQLLSLVPTRAPARQNRASTVLE